MHAILHEISGLRKTLMNNSISNSSLPNRFLDILVCPISHKKLLQLDQALLALLNRKIADNEITLADGQPVTEPVSEALVTEDLSRIYRILDGIPCLLEEEAIHTKNIPGFTQSAKT